MIVKKPFHMLTSRPSSGFQYHSTAAFGPFHNYIYSRYSWWQTSLY